MAFHDDLLEQARHLANRERTRPRQASLRRAVSAAYYALFHLLISEASRNWKLPEQRSQLGRQFQHTLMKEASTTQARVSANQLKVPDLGVSARDLARHLEFVANTFASLQDRRHRADYNTAARWTRSESLAHVDEAAEAFKRWRMIRTEADSQKYLFSLLFKPRA